MEKLIDAETEKQLKVKLMAELKGTVDVKVFTNPIAAPGDSQMAEINEYALQFMRELSAMDPRIIMQQLTTTDPAAIKLGIKTSPSLAVGYDLGYRIIYNGAPLGYEATGLIETVIRVSRGDAGFSQANRERMGIIEKETLIQVFVTPTCPYCPRSVLTANRMAIEARGKVTAECVESNENPVLSSKFGVSSVPQQVINGDPESIFVGAIPEDEFIKHVLKTAAPDKYAKAMEKELAQNAEKEKLADDPRGVIYLADGNFAEAVKKYGNVVADCWAEWCMPCKMLAPTIDELAAEYAGKIIFGKLNVDENPKIASENGILSIPTLLVYKNGELKGSVIGVEPKQVLELKLKELLGL
jgi:thioredoxin 1